MLDRNDGGANICETRVVCKTVQGFGYFNETTCYETNGEDS
jgi:hypothetical protein